MRTSSSVGTASRSAPIPAATPTTSTPIPSAVPSTCGTVRPNPNRRPDAHSTALFGPGETEPTNAKTTNATGWFTAIGSRGVG